MISFLVTPASAGGAYNIGDGLLPSDLDGSTLPPAGTPNFFMGSMDNGGPYGAPQDALTLWKFTADFTTPANSTFVLANTIPIAAYDTIFPCSPTSRNCIPQPGTTNKIDILSYRQRPMHRLAYRNFGTHESLVTNQSVEASTTMAGIRWWEIRSPNSSPVLYQDSTYAPGITDTIHRWMGSIAMDSAGNMALGYSASNGTTTFPSSWYTGRLAGDPLNTMPQGEGSIINGTGSQTGSAALGRLHLDERRPGGRLHLLVRQPVGAHHQLGRLAAAHRRLQVRRVRHAGLHPRRHTGRARRSASARTPSTRSTSAASAATTTR